MCATRSGEMEGLPRLGGLNNSITKHKQNPLMTLTSTPATMGFNQAYC